MITLKVATNFTETPGGRLRAHGNFSGEEFFENYLCPLLTRAIGNSEELTIDLDGGYGYTITFLDEAFGRLVMRFGSGIVTKTIKFISTDQPSLPQEILGIVLEYDNAGKMISQVEFEDLEKHFNGVARGLKEFQWGNEQHTLISFYAYMIRSTVGETVKAIDPDNLWRIQCQQVGGHDGGTYGTIQKKI